MLKPEALFGLSHSGYTENP